MYCASLVCVVVIICVLLWLWLFFLFYRCVSLCVCTHLLLFFFFFFLLLFIVIWLFIVLMKILVGFDQNMIQSRNRLIQCAEHVQTPSIQLFKPHIDPKVYIVHQLANVKALGSLPICSGYTMVETLGKSKPDYKNCGAHNEKSSRIS